MGDTITRVEHDTGGTTGGVQRQDGLDGDIHGRAVEGLEHDLRKREKRIDKLNTSNAFTSRSGVFSSWLE